MHSPNREISGKKARDIIKTALTQREYEGREAKIVSWVKDKFCQWRQEERRKVLAKEQTMIKYKMMDTEELLLNIARNKKAKPDNTAQAELAIMRKFAREGFREEDGDFYFQFKNYRAMYNLYDLTEERRQGIIHEDTQFNYSSPNLPDLSPSCSQSENIPSPTFD
ncbi:uncharacterized protein [Ptychodera flava]|uniref:uncharacterized protein n=1 Tax=Ptychodera flava TaxID=63121 RepID=UPI00396A3E62